MPETVIADRYRLDDLLSRSGMSEVWCAQDLELGRRVALKLLAPDADTARFEREARAFASLGHPNVTQLFDYGEADGRPYMVLEYVPGGTLEDRLGEGRPLPDDETRAIAAGIAAGLAHAHARGVVHRDLKPANVLFDEEGRPKLADFGIARMAAGEGTLTEAGTVLGTAAYISPEQAAGAPATAASDVYSFGAILYRMLTGRLPFESADPLELIALHRDAEVPPVSSLREDAPAALESTTTAALAKDPADRPRDGAALLAELGVPATAGLAAATALLAGEPTQVLPVAAAAGAGGAPRPPTRRSRVPLAVGALLVLALAGAGLAYEVTRPPDASPTTTVSTAPLTRLTTTHRQTGSTTTGPATSAVTTTQPATSAQQTTTRQTTSQQTITAPTPPPPPTTYATTTAAATTAATTTATTTAATTTGP